MHIEYDLKSNEIRITVSIELYTKEVLLKCFYWYLEDYEVEIEKTSNEIVVLLAPKKNTSLSNNKLLHLKTRIKQDIIDHTLRQIIAEETKNIRDLLVAKAFQNFESSD